MCDTTPPFSVVTVCVHPAGVSSPATVEISHTAASGWRDTITRPVDFAVPLFWRFVTTKFGLTPTP
ncbi:hypothetical protein [Longispora albida]|uniref:hypothetical protein n=1 Tax=Longispora albida TaxID=203523 RepID=UPI0012F71AAD|nr:hypothetical protein [Longispora albida]